MSTCAPAPPEPRSAASTRSAAGRVLRWTLGLAAVRRCCVAASTCGRRTCGSRRIRTTSSCRSLPQMVDAVRPHGLRRRSAHRRRTSSSPTPGRACAGSRSACSPPRSPGCFPASTWACSAGLKQTFGPVPHVRVDGAAARDPADPVHHARRGRVRQGHADLHRRLSADRARHAARDRADPAASSSPRRCTLGATRTGSSTAS